MMFSGGSQPTQLNRSVSCAGENKIMSVVTYESSERIATITINRAERMNALSEEVIQGLNAAWRRFAASDDRCAIIHAAGNRAWSVGADIKAPPKEM